ncbi:MAG: pilus assembly protein [Alphaproteobacteria bacterium]|nr:pilus assembly protein [Alphaproteobacteria bacterium]
MRMIRRFRRGANAMEFALTLPAFIAITFGMIEFGWYFSRVALLNSAVMAGCREGGLIDEDLEDPTTTALNTMDAVLTSGGLTCTDCTAVLSGANPNRVLECSAEIGYDGLTGWFMALGIMPNQITTQTQVRLEWQR